MQVEAAYWKLVTKRVAHVRVHSGNIDSGQSGYGFPCNKTSRHPWNLKGIFRFKKMSQSDASITPHNFPLFYFFLCIV